MDQPNTQPTEDQLRTLFKQEAAMILDFAVGPMVRFSSAPYYPTWTLGSSYETVAEHNYLTQIIALAIHALCVDRNLEPFCQIDGTRISLQALVGAALHTNNLFWAQFELEAYKYNRLDMALATIDNLTRPLSPRVASMFRSAWINQVSHTESPISQLVTLAETTASLLVSFTKRYAGVLDSDRAYKESLKELQNFAQTDSPLAIIAEAFVETFVSLIEGASR